jgi:hypothetical protein
MWHTKLVHNMSNEGHIALTKTKRKFKVLIIEIKNL